MAVLQPSITRLNATVDQVEWQNNQPITHIQPTIQPYNPALYTTTSATTTDTSADSPLPAHTDAVTIQHTTNQQRINTIHQLLDFNSQTNTRVDTAMQQQHIDATQRYNALPVSAKNYLAYLFGHQSIHSIRGIDGSLSEAQVARMKLLAYALPPEVTQSTRGKSKITDILTNDELSVYKAAVRETELAQSRVAAAEWRAEQEKIRKHTGKHKHTSNDSVYDEQSVDIVDDTVDDTPQPATHQLTQQQADVKQLFAQLRKYEFVPSVCPCNIDVHNVSDYNMKHIHNMICRYHDDIDAYIEALQNVCKQMSTVRQ